MKINEGSARQGGFSNSNNPKIEPPEVIQQLPAATCVGNVYCPKPYASSRLTESDYRPLRTLLAIIAFSIIVSHSFALRAAQTGGLAAEEVPTFQLRGRVLSIDGRTPPSQTFTFHLGVSSAVVTTTGVRWSEWLKYERPQVEATLKGYPPIYLSGFPVLVGLENGRA
jgi:hypothetical protein